MSQFLTPLDVRLLPESSKTRWMLISPLRYQSDVMSCAIEVPLGFITDFVSFEPLKDMAQRPAVIHDFLYSCPDVDREIADKVLREALACVGVDESIREAMYIAVRIFGGEHKDNLYNFYEKR